MKGQGLNAAFGGIRGRNETTNEYSSLMPGEHSFAVSLLRQGPATPGLQPRSPFRVTVFLMDPHGSSW